MPTFVAVDLGASSGRVVNVDVDHDHVALDVVHRFPTPTFDLPNSGLAWDVARIAEEVRIGLRAAVARTEVSSVAIDGWAVDYALLDADGALVGPVHAYRSARTDGVMDRVLGSVARDRIYEITGIQFLPFNTVFQLVAARDSPDYLAADRLLMLPDVLNAWLCGSTTNEITNASTTQMLDVAQRQWSDELIAALGLRREIMPALHRPGEHLGVVAGVGDSVDGVPVVAAASHDTASAVAGTALVAGRDAVYISCGTWSLVGCELLSPVLSDAAREANVTNELGVDGTVRLLKNVTGLWLLDECRRRWAEHGIATEPADLVAAAEHVAAGRSIVDPDDPRFSAPGDMPARIAAACRESGQPVPDSPAAFTRTILDSLALAWRRTVATIETIAGIDAEVIHLIGGGSAIPLLGRLCASACERPVLLGPQEATVVGNALVQAVAAGVLDDVEHGRRLVARTLGAARIEPQPSADWTALAGRLESFQ